MPPENENTEETTEETSTEETSTEEPFDADRAKAALTKKNNEAKNLRARLKEADAKAAKYDELQEANKSELQKAQDKAKSLEDAANSAQTDAMRLRVALRKGLSETQAKRLIGTNEEELEADADELLSSFDSKGNPPVSRPQERLRGGGDPTTEVEETDPAKLAEGLSLL